MKVYIGNYPKYFGPYQLVDKIFFFLSDEKKDKIVDWIPSKPFEWIDKRFNTRHIDIEIDDYDTWNAEHTLAMIIHPVLVKFRKNINSFPTNFDDTDIPKTVYDKFDKKDEISLKKWEWILDEMIWAFSQILEEDYESTYFSLDENEKIIVDHEGLEAHRKRIQRGLMLFSKYYLNLWN